MHDRDTTADDSPETRPLRTRRASFTFALVIGLMTSLQVLATPVTAMIQGPFDWPLPLPAALVFALLVTGCFVQAGALLLAERWPWAAVLGTVGVYVAVLVGLGVPNWLAGMYLVVALAQFLLASRVSALWAGATAFGAIMLGMGGLFVWAWIFGGDLSIAVAFTANEIAKFAVSILGATALGIWWGAQVKKVGLMRDRAELIRQEHEIRVTEAKERERARIAQELHDVAGQHLAGLMTLADAAMSLAPRRPADALRLVEEVRNEGRFAAASLAGALSDLHADNAATGEVTRDLRRSDDLVSFWSQRGVRVTLTSSGPVSDLPAVVSTTAYRALQEGFTNAAKHALGAEIAARVTVATKSLAVEIVNGPVGGSEPCYGLNLGWGLRGMRERVELLRGTMTAGPTPQGGWAVTVHIPVDGL